MSKHIIILPILLTVLGFFLLWNIEKTPIEEWDESTNADVVYQISQSNNFIELKSYEGNFFEKPPLWYIITSLIVKLNGYNEVSLRILSILSAVGIFGFIYLILYQRNNTKTVITSFLLFISSAVLFLSQDRIFSTHTFRSADLDSLMIFFITVAYYFLFQKESNKNFILAGIFSGMAIMTKGIPGIFPIIFFIVWKVYKKDKISITQLSYLVLPVILITMPWHIYMLVNYRGEFINQYFVYHNVARSLNSIEGHGESIAYYFKNFINPLLFSFGIFYLYSLCKYRKNLKIKESYYNFAISIVPVFTIVLFTLIPTKLIWYILPIVPLCILFTAEKISTHKYYSYLFLFFVILSLINLFNILKIEKSPLQQQISENIDKVYVYDELSKTELFYLNKYGIEKKSLFDVYNQNLFTTNKNQSKFNYIYDSKPPLTN